MAGLGARPGAQRAGPGVPSARHSAQGHGGPYPGSGVRDRGGELGEDEKRPGAICPRLAPARGRRYDRAARPVAPVEPAHGRYSRRKTALRRARWAQGARGARRGARRWARLSSWRGRRSPARGTTEEPRGRSGQPGPRRRLVARAMARDGARGAPCWKPLGTARG